MTIRRRLIIEFSISLVLGTAMCLAVSAYLAATSSATGVAASNDTSLDPPLHAIGYSGMGFAIANPAPESQATDLRNSGFEVRDPKWASAAVQRSFKALRDRGRVTMAGAYGWPLIFCDWTLTGTAGKATLEGSYSWGPPRSFLLEMPVLAAARASAWGSGQVRTSTITQLPSYLLPKVDHLDVGAFVLSASVFVVGCWIVVHVVIEVTKAVVSWGARTE